MIIKIKNYFVDGVNFGEVQLDMEQSNIPKSILGVLNSDNEIEEIHCHTPNYQKKLDEME